MHSQRLPTVRWQHQSQLGDDRQHSLLISLLRGLAALQVAFAHLRAETFPGLSTLADPPLYYQVLAFATGFAHEAVVVFFLISGWLVGGSLLNKFEQPQSISSYAVDRLSRLWTVLLPTLVLMVLAGIATDTLTAQQADFSVANEYSALSFLGNLFGLQTVLVKNFGGNYALWSLANETWYYLLFPLLLVVLKGRGLGRAASVVAIAAIAIVLPSAIVLYFGLWLLGAAFSRVRIDCSHFVRVALLTVTACAFVYSRLSAGVNTLSVQSFPVDLLCSLPLVALLSSLQSKVDPASRPLRRLAAFARFFSEFSFTLYVLHVPTIGVLRHIGRTVFGRAQLMPDAPLDYAIYFGMGLFIVAVAYLSYLLFESHTFRIRRLLKDALLRRGPGSARAVAATAK
jgi:peptidoglycan/LPS O-acetylase OafA/YrhL